jgi:His-Xaa-Ser system protein HxsD
VTAVTVEFSAGMQTIGALRAAAYRLIGTATCEIDQAADRWICRLTSVSSKNKNEIADPELLKEKFIELVTDENLREQITARTEGVRNVILSLAFGSLAQQPSDKK